MGAHAPEATLFDQPRLRSMVSDGSKTYEKLRRGARASAEGVDSAIRNAGMHDGEGG
jgi:hypothetical protein